jgi:hypothetical protein
MITIMDTHPDKVSPEPNSGCWLWAGAVMNNGYGEIKIAGKKRTAHRFSCELTNGLSAGCVQHKCDNRLCVNPAHLTCGSYAQNNLDLWRRGGRTGKLSKETADSLRADPGRSEKGFLTRKAREYGVSKQAIWRVLNGKMYVV